MTVLICVQAEITVTGWLEEDWGRQDSLRLVIVECAQVTEDCDIDE